MTKFYARRGRSGPNLASFMEQKKQVSVFIQSNIKKRGIIGYISPYHGESD
jgi:hypothetical protein